MPTRAYRRLAGAILAVSIVLHMIFVIGEPFWVSAYDLASPQKNGHWDYVCYLITHLRFPEYVLCNYEFYHPPVWYIVSAVQVLLGTFINPDEVFLLELLQAASCGYVCIGLIYMYRLLVRVCRNDIILVVCMMLVCFHSHTFVMATVINNDNMAWMFSVMTLYYLVRWYQSDGKKHMCGVTVCFSLGLLTKMSVALLAPVIAGVFIYVYICKGTGVLQYVFFLGVVLVFGLSWYWRNWFVCDAPMTYAYEVSYTYDSYISGNILQRLFTLGSSDKLGVCYIKQYGGRSNIIVNTLNTMLYGDNLIIVKNRAWQCFIYAFGVVNIFTGISLVLDLVKGFKYADKVVYSISIAGLCVTFVAFLGYCMGFPAFCTMNYRYVMLTVPLLALGLSQAEVSWRSTKGVCVCSVMCCIMFLSQIL